MSIKPEAERYFIDADTEKRLALRLDEAFNITYRNTIGLLSFWFADPKSHTKQRFGLNQEVLVIYSPFPETDARVLTAIENIVRNKDFKHRIDKVMVLLIHKGGSDTTESLLKKQTDWVIVPFTESELLDTTKGNIFIRARIASNVGESDLFGISSPLKSDSYFFGREQLVTKIIKRSNEQGESSGVFGLRKTGKTSVLYAVHRRLKDYPILVEYYDCQNPGIHSARWWQVLENITDAINTTLRDFHKREGKIQGEYTQSNAGTRFSSNIKSILTNGDLDKIIIMLDEIEYITPGLSGRLGQHWDQDFIPFWQTIRAVHQETLGRFIFIVAGVNPKCVETSHIGTVQNPIFQLAVPQYLEPLETQDIRQMVRTIGKYAGLNFKEDVYGYLQEFYGGHPFLIRIACSEVWRHADTLNPDQLATISIKSFQEVSNQLQSRLSQPIKDILLSLVWWYKDEYELLEILASGDDSFVQEYLKASPNSLLQFARYGILHENGSFAIADLKAFLNQYGKDYISELFPFTRGDMPPHLLPEIPNIKLLGELFENRTKIEVKLRELIIMYFGVKTGWDNNKIAEIMLKGISKRQDRKKPDDLFVGIPPKDVIQELYTMDLKRIITENWDIFNTLFDNKSRFEMNMDTINTARRVDGHTKPVTTEEADEFNNSYHWLWTKLCKIPTTPL